jgi:hypothetical protein
VRVALVAVVAVGVGVVTSFLQRYLDAPWDSLVNAASPWLTPMFLLGVLWRRPWAAALAELATGLLELLGYYVTASLRGSGRARHFVVLGPVRRGRQAGIRRRRMGLVELA